MSDAPPPPEGTPPPQQYVAYPRGATTAYGSAQQLQALGSGYYGLNIVFGINILLSLASFGLSQVDLRLYLIGVLVEVVAITILIYRENLKIAYGKGWSQTMGVVVSLLMGISSALCCGIFGYIIMQQIAGSEMKKYGLRSGFLGVKKKDWQAMVAQMQESQAAPVPAPPFTPPPASPPSA